MNEPSAIADYTERLSRRARLTLYVSLVIISIVFMIASVIAVVLIMDKCSGSVALGSSGLCSDKSRLPLELASLAILTAIVFRWTRFLRRALAIDKDAPAAEQAPPTQGMLAERPLKDTRLRFGQILMSGTVELTNSGFHRIVVRGLALRFWGGYALRQKWIKNGDRAVFVYQRVPALGLNYVLAFRKSQSQIRGVGGVIHSYYLALAPIGALTALSLKTSAPWWLMPVCIALFIESSTYLALLNVAKRALRESIGHPI